MGWFTVRRANRIAGVVLVLCLGRYLHAQDTFIAEHVEVGRALIDVSVTDASGQAVPHLRTEDFSVSIDGEPARVHRADWHGTQLRSSVQPERPGRSVVFLIQRTLDSNVARRERDVVALSRALHLSGPILAALAPADCVAVLSLDQHLKLWTDFTADRSDVNRILRTDVMTGRPPGVAPATGTSLVRAGLPAIGAVTYTMDDSLVAVANALRPLPGAKTLVLFGYGFGTPDSLKRSLAEAAALPGLLDPRQAEVVEALTSARVSVVSIDVTEARRHALEVGLQEVAEQTGGLYVRADPFPDLAMRQVANALDGYYTLSVERPTAQLGRRRLDVRVAGDLHVRAPSAYVE